MDLINLEPLCARYGSLMIEEKNDSPGFEDQENVITKALAVLAENGLYAMTVFLLSLSNKKTKKYGQNIVIRQLHDLWSGELKLIKKQASPDATSMAKVVREEIAKDLHKLILAKKVTEQALTFARYHAKAEIAGDATPKK